MGAERYPLLLLLASIAASAPGVSATGVKAAVAELPGAQADIVRRLHSAVQDRLMPTLGAGTETIQDAERQLAQWYNFPNFFNQGCIRGYWKNC